MVVIAKIVLEENLDTEVLKLEGLYKKIKLKESLNAEFKCKVDQLETGKQLILIKTNSFGKSAS